MTLYKFNILFKGDEDFQQRFVLARTEEQAYKKIEEYRKSLEKLHFADFDYFYIGVEIENIIT